VTRLLLVPIAFLCLLAGLAPIVTGLIAGWHGLGLALADPGLAPVLGQAGLAALVAVALAVPLGLAGGLAVAAAPVWERGLVYALAVGLLIAPAPGFGGLTLIRADHLASVIAFACAVARGAAIALLILAPALGALPPRLRQSAMLAGATPFQAWRHAILAPLLLPLAGAAIAAAGVAFVEGPAAAVLAPHLALAQAWIAPASLLLSASAAAALSVLLRRRPA
jgi:thiamine transport system permease protein